MRTRGTLRGILLSLSVGLAATLASAGPAAAQALFLPPATSDLSVGSTAVQPRPPQAVRDRLVRIDANILTRHMAPAGADNAADRAQRAQALDGVLVLNLFDDTTLTLRRTAVKADDLGGYVWEGAATGQAFHEALLIVRDGQVSGRVQMANRIFTIEHAGNGLTRINELDPRKFPPGSEPRIPPHGRATPYRGPALSTPDHAEGATPHAITNIRVLILFTPKVLQESGSLANLTSTISQAMALANQAFTRGNLPFRFQLADKMQVSYAEGGDNNYNANLTAFTNGINAGSGVWAAVKNKRNTAKADLVVMLRAGPNFVPGQVFTCGLAWIGGSGAGVMGPVTAADGNYAYSVTGHRCIASLAFHHETGHNMGLQHDRYQYKKSHAAPNNSVYNFGFTNTGKKVYTIMAYFVECVEKSLSCAAINYYSSPLVKAQPGNITIGVAQNGAGAADNTRRLKETYTAVSNYRN